MAKENLLKTPAIVSLANFQIFKFCCDIQGSHLIGYLWVSLIIDQLECLICYFLCTELTLFYTELTLFCTELPENCICYNQSKLSNFPCILLIHQIYQFQVSDHDELLAKWPRCETNICWVKKSAERHGNPAQGETCDEHDNLWFSFHVSENESLAACSLQISNDLFRCPKNTH